MTNENQETKLADFKEVIADIAYEAGQAGYKQEDSRGTINQIIAWANEFTEAHKNTDWSMTDYMETVFRFADEKLETSNMEPAKPRLLAFAGFGDYVHCNNCDTTMLLPIGADTCPLCHKEGCMNWMDKEKQELSALHLESQYHVIYKQVKVPIDSYSLFESEIFAQMHQSPKQHTAEDIATPEPPAERDGLAEILADTDKCETFGCIVIDEISNDEETPSKTGSNLIQAYQNGDCDAMLIALCGWSMDSLLDKYNEKWNGDDADEVCPKCDSSTIRYDVHESLFHCDGCGQTWSDKQYVLVEYPEDASCFEQKEIGYPSWESQDNGARYVSQHDYIRQFGKSPDPVHCYHPVCWPDSQRYFEETRPDAHCELIQDEGALEIFGSSALWVPLCMLD